jgi:hypothetical protein
MESNAGKWVITVEDSSWGQRWPFPWVRIESDGGKEYETYEAARRAMCEMRIMGARISQIHGC